MIIIPLPTGGGGGKFPTIAIVALLASAVTVPLMLIFLALDMVFNFGFALGSKIMAGLIIWLAFWVFVMIAAFVIDVARSK